jgi:hypothetical protein
MTDVELVETAKSLARMCSPKENFGQPPLEVWVAQLREARGEWRPRHPRL